MINFRTCALVLALILGSLTSVRAQDQSQPKVDNGPVVGVWSLEVSTGEESYVLTLELKLIDGKLEGSLSEMNGLFSNATLSGLEFDGATLKFETRVPTPPDGVQRLITTEAKLAEGKLQGMITVPELSVIASLAGEKR